MTRDFRFEEVRACIAHVSRLFLVSDFDGTLAPIAGSPELAQLPKRTEELLRRLSASPKVVLAIISGRRLEDVQRKVGIPAIYAGNHGLEISGPGIDYVHPEVNAFVGRLSRQCDALEKHLAAWPGAWIENKTLTATVHFRDVSVERWPELISTLRTVLSNQPEPFELRTGNAALEICPPIDWDKGAALKYLRHRLELQHALTICLGDDTTDESMFRAVSDGITIRVGESKYTDATFTFANGVDEVPVFLQQLLETIETKPQPSAVWRPPRSGICRGAAR